MSVLHYKLVQDTLYEYKSNGGVLDVESALAFGRRITAEANIQKLALLFKERGINIYYVGGCVRDELLNIISNDIDIAVEFGTFQDILDIVTPFASHITEETVGNQFAVVKATIDGQEFDFSLCRGEVKTGDKHSDFLLDFKATIIEDLRRRDITINAMAKCPLTGVIIDPFGGQKDLVNRIAREVSKAFAEDPLRVLRVARFIARYNLTPTQSLIDMCISLDWSTISRERIGGELYKVFKQSIKPSLFFEYLNLVGWLQPIFTELHALIGVEQNPKHHPEGSRLILSSVSSSRTSSTETIRINSTFRKFLKSSKTFYTGFKPTFGTFTTQSIVDLPTLGFSSTFCARSNSLNFSSLLTPAIITKPISFMFGAGTSSADKSFRVMFKIPKSSMVGIMSSATNNFEILKRIVNLVMVYMMDMLSSFKSSTFFKAHKKSMESNCTKSWIRDALISSIKINFTPNSINSNVFCSVNFNFVGNFKVLHSNSFIKFINSTTISKGDMFNHVTFKTDFICGDAYNHVLHTIDAAEDVFTRVVMLCHDLGKATTAKINPKTGYNSFYRHELKSVPLARQLMKRIAIESIEGFGIRKVNQVLVLSELHMLHTLTSISDGKLAERIHILHKNNLKFNDLVKVMKADESGRPPIVPDFTFIESLIQRVDTMVDNGRFIPIVTSEKLFALGAKQGLELGTIIKEGFRLQLKGVLNEGNWVNLLGIENRKRRWDKQVKLDNAIKKLNFL